ncbi:hypothetical protein [Alteromonas sp. 14N.309.X.WAT.G.H12]|uniref:hypothetical protein n=1 Tax=Alteromonas sp. 14N.309.X.WAT.G.H12 TaxID=3120824 RepID=UPI002FD1E635
MKIAQYRRLTESLNRKAHVDYHACVTSQELDGWRMITTRLVDDAIHAICPRAKLDDVKEMSKAIAKCNDLLAISP